MRVIAGSARSLKLKTPEGMDTRPTTDRIKETLFNMLQGELLDCVFVDLFAGSGGIGIEALSRGARHAWFVESNRQAIRCIEENLAFTKFADSATVLKQDVFGALSLIREKADIVFMDPPYRSGEEERLFRALREAPCVGDSTLLILEAELHRQMDFLEEMDFQILKEKRYKTNKHVFVTKRVSQEVSL